MCCPTWCEQTMTVGSPKHCRTDRSSFRAHPIVDSNNLRGDPARVRPQPRKKKAPQCPHSPHFSRCLAEGEIADAEAPPEVEHGRHGRGSRPRVWVCGCVGRIIPIYALPAPSLRGPRQRWMSRGAEPLIAVPPTRALHVPASSAPELPCSQTCGLLPARCSRSWR